MNYNYMMELLLLLAILFLIVVILVLGIVFTYLSFRIFNLETNILPDKESGDVINRAERIPLDKFIPRSDQPIKVKYSEKDQFTKE